MGAEEYAGEGPHKSESRSYATEWLAGDPPFDHTVTHNHVGISLRKTTWRVGAMRREAGAGGWIQARGRHRRVDIESSAVHGDSFKLRHK